MEASHSVDVPRDADGNCAVCHQPIRENKPPRKKVRRLSLSDPDGALEEKLMILSERWEDLWPTMSMGSPGWRSRVADFALQEIINAGIMPSESGQ